VKSSFRKYFRIIFLEEKIGLKMNYLKNRGLPIVRLGQRIGKNGSWHRVGAGRRDEMKKCIYILTVGNLSKGAKGIYTEVSNV
jgi:hypothetical protein